MTKELIPAISATGLDATRTGLIVQSDVPFDVWLAYGRGLSRVEGAIQWLVGDWLNFGEAKYGETYSQAFEIWPESKYQQLADYKWLSSSVQFSLRNENLSWWHHREIAKLEPAEQKRWLADAEKRSWSVRDLRAHMALEKPGKAMGPLFENEGVEFGYWALERPLTSGWGSGQVWPRMIAEGLGTPDVAFGVRDNIPTGVTGVDRSTGYEWAELPFADNEFNFGYWDPPYDSLYKPEGIEIWRTVKRLAILHTFIWPRSWLDSAIRRGMYAITMGPMKQIRCLQVFDKVDNAGSS